MDRIERRLEARAKREHRKELEETVAAAVRLEVVFPHVVRESVRRVLAEADDIQEARELAGLDDNEDGGPA